MSMEIWKDIEGYEGLYQVSSEGRVKSIYRYKKVLIPYITDKNRKRVHLCKNGKAKWFFVHQLVAKAFVPNPNPNNYTQVNHKDENPLNNFVWVNDDGSVDLSKSNLEWCDAKYNTNYGTCIKRRSDKHARPILQLRLDGTVVREWRCMEDAAKETGYLKTCICLCCKGKQKTAYGFKWSYAA